MPIYCDHVRCATAIMAHCLSSFSCPPNVHKHILQKCTHTIWKAAGCAITIQMEITEATIGHQNQLTIRPKN